MLDVTARDGLGRLSTWTTDQGEIRLPAVAHVHSERNPAPGFASLVIARTDHASLPTLLVQGSVFSASETAEGDTVVPKALVYPSASGNALQAAADRVNARGRVALAHRSEAVEAHDGLVVLPNARFLARDPWRLASFLVESRERAGPNAVLLAPGLGRPEEIALAVYAGVDVLDGLAPVLAAMQGNYLTTEGPLHMGDVTETTCACDACHEADGAWTRALLVRHAQWVAEAESRRVRQALAAGTLRELVEARVRAAPELVATLRRLDRHHLDAFLPRTPAVRTRKMPILSHESVGRPEIRRWVERLGTRYVPPEDATVLVVLPCSATKPYENSPSHRRMRAPVHRYGQGLAHIVTLTSPLGAVPEELEYAYPAQQYDIPVTGAWYEAERAVVHDAFAAIASQGGYDHVLLHLVEEEAALVEDLFPKAERTVLEGESPTDGSALERLGDAVREATRDVPAVKRKDRFADAMRARIDWQFGPGVGEVLLEGARIRGRYPRLKVLDGNTQLALFQPERGVVTLTSDGARRLHAATDAYNVEIEDFEPKGTVFAVGVKAASPAILVEDDVLLVHEGELRATGRAVAPGVEMAAMKRGPAVEVRHRC